jgi:hypothetical protein
VLRHNDVWRAGRTLSVRRLRVWRRARCRSIRVRNSGNQVGRRDVVASLTSSQQRRLTPMKVNPVRQCARRGVVDLGVAQASPLFSDHAPREVHLWQ